MCLSVLAQCSRRIPRLNSRQCLQSCGIGNILLNRGPQFCELHFIDGDLLSKHREGLGKQIPKFCSSSTQSNFSQIKAKVNQYTDIISKENGLNLAAASANITVASKELLQTIRTDLGDLKSCPTAPLVLGFAGLIPFIAAPVHFIMSAAFAPGVAYGQLAYGAVILSFLGGVRWGIVLDEPKWDSLVRSVIPSLVGWTSLLVPHWIGCFFVAAGLISVASADRKHPKYQPWFRSLRVALTTVAVVTIGSSLFLGLVLPVAKN